MFDLALPDRKRPERSPHLRLPAEPPGAVLPSGGALEPLRRQPSVILLPFWASSLPRHRLLPRKVCIANSRSRFSRFPFPRHTLFAGFPCIASRKRLFWGSSLPRHRFLDGKVCVANREQLWGNGKMPLTQAFGWKSVYREQRQAEMPLARYE